MADLRECPFCQCINIYEVEREDIYIGHYPQIFCNGCKMTFEIENDSPYLNDETTYNYLREKLLKAWNRRTKIETNIYDKEETYPNCTVQVLTNTVTGDVSVGWWENGGNEDG